jgi:signal transduction histidine kinase/CheY-like chemotaxis protein/ABC-type amino acid transport substrate-binding protein
MTIAVIVSGCGKTAPRPFEPGNLPSLDGVVSPFTSFREIPEVTNEETAAIEALQKKYSSFVYGMPPTAEAFLSARSNGEVRGFSALFCEWLTGLFQINFRPAFYAWGDLIAGLEHRDIDFTGDLMATEERRTDYFMTDAIAERSLSVFRMADSPPLPLIAASRPLCLAFLRDSAAFAPVVAVMDQPFEAIFINDYPAAYEALTSGKADAFLSAGISEASFIAYGNVISETFFPLIYNAVSLSTKNPEFVPIINVVQKALRHSDTHLYLSNLYQTGHDEYRQHKLFTQLSPDELTYIENNRVIKFAAEIDNYPISFYNIHEHEWQGVAHDVLVEVEKLTGLRFEIANPPDAPWAIVMGMLERGEAALISELVRTDEQEGRFLWPDTAIMEDHTVLLSRSEYPNIELNEVLNVRVGVIRNSIYAELFKRWFPNHEDILEYDSIDDLLGALERGEIEMMMGRTNQFLNMINYREILNYKINIMFNSSFKSSFGLHKDETVLRSLLDKSLRMIDTESIALNWTYKAHDYRVKMAEARLPWLIGATTLSLLVLALILALFFQSHIERKQLIKKQAEVEAANHAKSSFLTTMSHEMRTPMNAILGIAEIQLQDEDLSPDMKDALHMIYNSGYSLMRVLNDLLDLSKIEAGKLGLINDRYETVNLINDAINLNVLFTGSKPIQFKLHVDENMPLELIGDELHIKQVVNNLLSNAFKYTDSGEVRLSFSAQITDGETAADGNADDENAPNVTLTIGVSDTGHGMTEAQIQNLFDAYSHFNLKANRLVEGTGLGMNIVQQLVNKMGGNIAVNSTVGGGTEVTVHLIQGYAGPSRLGKDLAKNLIDFRLANILKNKDQILREPMPYGKVLVVDDMETNLYVARGFLLPYGLIVDTALSGMEAIEKIESGNVYDIVFMDHMMPEMDGMEAVRIMRGKGYTRPIVALTANAVSGQAEMFMANGFDGFISKPIDIRELNASLNKFVRDRHTAEEIEAAHAAYGGGAVVDDATPQADPGLAKIFARDAEKAIAVLQGYEERNVYGSDDLQAYIINVHALKSALANIGETKLSGFARELEQAGRERKIDFISEETSAFLGELRAVVDKLKPDAEEYGAGNVSDEDMAYLRKKLLTVKEACAVYDKKAAKAALAELKQKPWSLSYGELLDTIAEYLLHSDFDEAEAACAAYLSMDSTYLGRGK